MCSTTVIIAQRPLGISAMRPEFPDLRLCGLFNMSTFPPLRIPASSRPSSNRRSDSCHHPCHHPAGEILAETTSAYSHLGLHERERIKDGSASGSTLASRQIRSSEYNSRKPRFLSKCPVFLHGSSNVGRPVSQASGHVDNQTHTREGLFWLT